MADGTRKSSKQPLRCDGKGFARSNDPSTWSTFNEAIAFAQTCEHAAGLGLMLTGDVTVLDYDHVVDPCTGQLVEPAARTFRQLPETYTEVSASGDGLHQIYLGAKPLEHVTELAHAFGPGTELGVYSTGRYILMTGVPFGHKKCQPIVGHGGLRPVVQLASSLDRKRATESQLARDEIADQRAEATGADIELVRAALAVIPATDHEVWLKVSMALHGLPGGHELWEEWSQSAPAHYNEEENERRWRSFDAPHPNRPTLGTIIHLADQAHGGRSWRPCPFGEVTDESIESLASWTQSRGGADSPPVDRTSPCVAAVFERWWREGPALHLPTGIRGLDAMTGGGLVLGSRVVINGQPDAGKTALQVHLADEWLNEGHAVGILSVDEEPEDLLTRLLQRRGITRRDVEQRAQDKLAQCEAELNSAKLRLYDHSWTIEAAVDDLMKLAAETAAHKILFIDSLQVVTSTTEEQGDNDMQRIDKRLRAIQRLASEHRMLVISTSEMNRAAYASRDKARRTTDMAAGKGSGSIEFKARVLISLGRTTQSDVLEIRVVKNKHGRSHRTDEDGLFLRLDRDRQQLKEEENFRPEPDASGLAKALEAQAILAEILIEAGGDFRSGLSKLRVAAKEKGLGQDALSGAIWNLQKVGALDEQKSNGGRNTYHIHRDKLPVEVVRRLRSDLVESIPDELFVRAVEDDAQPAESNAPFGATHRSGAE